MITIEHICKELDLDNKDILNIYPYGSRVYGTNNSESDYDFIIVFKSAFLDSGGFKDNAISNEDKTIQATCYSRTGFIDAINTYQLPALEALSTEAIKFTRPFNLEKYNEKEMVKKVITQSSNSWYLANRLWSQRESPDVLEKMKKGVWHSIRILEFGIQFKEEQKIKNFKAANFDFKQIMKDDEFTPDNYSERRGSLTFKLKQNG